MFLCCIWVRLGLSGVKGSPQQGQHTAEQSVSPGAAQRQAAGGKERARGARSCWLLLCPASSGPSLKWFPERISGRVPLLRQQFGGDQKCRSLASCSHVAFCSSSDACRGSLPSLAALPRVPREPHPLLTWLRGRDSILFIPSWGHVPAGSPT